MRSSGTLTLPTTPLAGLDAAERRQLNALLAKLPGSHKP